MQTHYNDPTTISELYQCTICYQNYNLTDRIPKFLKFCGHNLCEFCLKHILTNDSLKCPICRTDLPKNSKVTSDFPNSLLIMQFLDTQMCKVHNQPKNLVCITDCEEICIQCEKKRHHGHHIAKIEDVKNQASEKIDQVRKHKKNLSEKADELHAGHKKQIDGVKKNVKEKFNLAKRLLEKIEEEVCMGIDEGYGNGEIEKIDQDYDETMMNYLEVIGYLRQSTVNKSYVEALNKEIEEPNVDKCVKKLKLAEENIEDKVNMEVKDVPLYMSTILQGFDNFKNDKGNFDKGDISSKTEEYLDKMIKDEFIIKDNVSELNIKPISPVKVNDTSLFILEKIMRKSFSKKIEHDSHMEHLALCLSNQRPIRYSFSLDLQNCSKITDFSVNSICDGVELASPYLDFLNLIFTKCNQLTDDSIKTLTGKLISKAKVLNELNLNVAHCPKITDEGMKALCASLDPIMLNLTILKLSFSACKLLSEDGVQYLSNLLNREGLILQELRLSLGKCKNITNRSTIDLCNALKAALPTLEKLSLRFGGCHKLSDDTLIALSNSFIEAGGSLGNLMLDFSNCEGISDRGLAKFNDALSNCLGNLNHLELYFDDNPNISDVQVERLAEGLDNIAENLEYLAISFNKCSNITGNGLNSLSSMLIDAVPRLTYLKLDFRIIPQVSTNAFEGLSKALCTIINTLNHLEIYIAKDKEVNDINLKLLGEAIKKRGGQLNHLKLTFDGCSRLTELGVESLVDCLCDSEVLELQNLVLSFPGCRLVSRETLEEFEKQLAERFSDIQLLKIDN